MIADLPPTLGGIATQLVEVPPCGAAVYFLCDGPAVLYVGKSEQPAARVGRHRSSKRKPFSRAVYLPTDSELLDDTEREWIERLKPVHNARGNSHCAPGADAWGPTSDLRQLSVRLDAELKHTIDELLVAAKAATGLRISRGSLFCLAVQSLREKYAAMGLLKEK